MSALTDNLAAVCAHVGVSPTLGRLFGVLLLAPEPLSLEALASAAGAAKSTASVMARRLEALGLVERTRDAERRDWYAVSPDFAGVLGAFSVAAVRPAVDGTTSGCAAAERAPGVDPVVRARLRRLRVLGEVAGDLLRALDGAGASPEGPSAAGFRAG